MVKQLVCLVIDEAHRASGNYSYCVAVREVCLSFKPNPAKVTNILLTCLSLVVKCKKVNFEHINTSQECFHHLADINYTDIDVMI